MTVKEIAQAVAKEAAAFRQRTKKLPGAKVYDMAYNIHLVEEITFLVCEYPDEYKDDDVIVDVLTKYCGMGCFLTAFLTWAGVQDSVDVSNIEKSLETLEYFCDCQAEEPA